MMIIWKFLRWLDSKRKTIVPPGWNFIPGRAHSSARAQQSAADIPARDYVPTLVLRDKEGRPLYNPQWDGPQGHKATCQYVRHAGTCSCGWAEYCNRPRGLKGTDEELQMACGGFSEKDSRYTLPRYGHTAVDRHPMTDAPCTLQADYGFGTESFTDDGLLDILNGKKQYAESESLADLDLSPPVFPTPEDEQAFSESETAPYIRHAGIYALGKRLWNTAYVKYQHTGIKPTELMDLALEMAKISLEYKSYNPTKKGHADGATLIRRTLGTESKTINGDGEWVESPWKLGTGPSIGPAHDKGESFTEFQARLGGLRTATAGPNQANVPKHDESAERTYDAPPELRMCGRPVDLPGCQCPPLSTPDNPDHYGLDRPGRKPTETPSNKGGYWQEK